MTTKDFEYRFLKIGKRKPKITLQEGDVFAFSVEEGIYMWGRIVRVDKYQQPGKVTICKYYKYTSHNLNPPKSWKDEDLIIDLQNESIQLWQIGDLITIENQPLSPQEIDAKYCFQLFIFPDEDQSDMRYCDEQGNYVSRFEPCLQGGTSGGVTAYKIRKAIHNQKSQ